MEHDIEKLFCLPRLDSNISCQAAPPLNYFLSPFRSPWTDLLFTLLRLFLLHVDPFLTLPGFWQSWLGYSPLDAFLSLLMLPRFWQPAVSHPLTDTFLTCLGSGFPYQADLPHGCAPFVAQALMLRARMPLYRAAVLAPLWTTTAPLFLRIYAYHMPPKGFRTRLFKEEKRRRGLQWFF